MASKDNKEIKFDSHDGKSYRKFFDKRGQVKYSVKEGKSTKFIQAKEFVKESSRFHAKERIRKIKEDADRKSREAEEAKASAILEAERKKRDEEFQKKALERAKNKKKNINAAKEFSSLQQAQELERLLKAISEENDEIARVTNKVLDKHEESLKVSYWKGISKGLFRLSEQFGRLDKKLSDLYLKVATKKVVTDVDIKEFDKLVAESDPLYKRLDSLMKEATNREETYNKKEDEKTTKRRTKKREERIDLVSEGRKKQKEKRDKKRAERIELVAEGRKKQAERSQSQLFEQYDQEKKNRLSKREKSDKFFSTNVDDFSKLGKFSVGTGKVLGGLAMAPFKALGFDFQDEMSTLGTLFSPLTALGKTGYGALKGGVQKLQGIDDKSLEKMEDVFTNPGLGKKKKVDAGKVSQKLQNPKSSFMSKIGGKLGSMFGSSSPITNNTSNSNSSNSSSSNQTNNSFTNSSNSSRSSFMGGPQSSPLDLNRTDDVNGIPQIDRTNELLEKILKELGGSSQGTGKTKRGFPGGMFGKAGGIAALGVGGALLGNHIAGKWSEMFSDRKSSHVSENTSTSTKNVLVQKLTSRNASKEDIDTYQNLITQEIDARKVNDIEQIKKIKQQRNSILNKYSIKNNSMNSELTSLKNDSSTTFRDSENNSTIRSEINKIEKMNDVKDDPEKRTEEMKSFLLGDFITKLGQMFAGLQQTKKGGGPTTMPSMKPF